MSDQIGVWDIFSKYSNDSNLLKSYFIWGYFNLHFGSKSAHLTHALLSLLGERKIERLIELHGYFIFESWLKLG